MLSFIDFICYDDACHLRKFSSNPAHADLTPQLKTLAKIKMVVDRMHMKGHIDQWCKQNSDAKNLEALKKVRKCVVRDVVSNNTVYLYIQIDTEVCEQVFSWLSRCSKMTKRMDQHTVLSFILYLCELHNRFEEEKLKRSGFLK